MGFQVTKTGAFAFPHKLDNQNGHEGCKVDCQDSAERMLDSFPSCSDIGIIQVEDLMDLMLIIFVVLNFIIYLEIETSRLR